MCFTCYVGSRQQSSGLAKCKTAAIERLWYLLLSVNTLRLQLGLNGYRYGGGFRRNRLRRKTSKCCLDAMRRNTNVAPAE